MVEAKRFDCLSQQQPVRREVTTGPGWWSLEETFADGSKSVSTCQDGWSGCNLLDPEGNRLMCSIGTCDLESPPV
jgi:hypothetical protein